MRLATWDIIKIVAAPQHCSVTVTFSVIQEFTLTTTIRGKRTKELHWTEVNSVCHISRGWQKSIVGVFHRCHISSGPSVTKQALWYQYWLQEFLPLFLPFFTHSSIVLHAFSSVMASVCRVLLWTRPVTFPESKTENINFNHVFSSQTLDPIRQIMERRDSNIQTLVPA